MSVEKQIRGSSPIVSGVDFYWAESPTYFPSLRRAESDGWRRAEAGALRAGERRNAV